jgi:hypothetical protein
VNRPTLAPPLTFCTFLLVGVIAGFSAVTHAQYADFKSGTNLEDWRTGQIGKASVAVVNDGGIVVFASVSDPYWSKHLILWKLRADGSQVWSRTWRLDDQSPISFSPRLNLVVAPDGSLIMTGAFRESINFGNGQLVSAGYADIFLVKLDRSGNLVWSRSFGGAGVDHGYQLLVDASGNITLAGTHSGADFGGGVIDVPENVTTFYRATFGPDGTYVSSTSFGSSTGSMGINDMTINDTGDVYAIGGSYLTMTFGNNTLENAGSADIIMVGFDATGSLLTARRFGGKYFETGHGIVQTDEGDLLTTGIIADKVSLGGPVLETSWIGGAFVARYGADGEHKWSRANESSEYGTSECTTIALHPSGGIVATGSFTGGVQFDQTSLLAGSKSILTLRFDADGHFLWMGNGTGEATVLSVVAKPDGNTVLVGSNTSNLAFCTGDVITTPNARGFVAEFTDTPHFDSQAPSVPAHPAYDGATVTWDASPDPEGAAVRYQVDERILPSSIEKRTIVSSTSMPLNADETRNRFIDVTAFDCFGHASEPTNRIEIHPSQTAPLEPADVHFEVTSLVWTTPTDADVVGVAVDGTNTFGVADTVRLAMTMTPGLNVENLSYRTYYLMAVDASGNWGQRVIIGDAVPPPVPTGLAYAIPTLTWDASEDKGFGYFMAYASPFSDFSKEKHLLVETRKSEFDVPIDERDSYYHIVQMDLSGNTSAPTTVAGPGGARPARPRSLAYRDGRLSWKTTDTDIDRYEIFASTTDASEGPRVLLGSTSELEFVPGEDHAWYRVVAIDEAGQESVEAVVSAITGLAPSFALSLGVLTNPFRGATTLQYALPKAGQVKIDLYDVRGAHVVTLVNGMKPGGSHYVDWNGGSENRGDAPSGVYFARLQFGRDERVAKVIRLR